MKITVHCVVVSEVMSELCTDYWPGVRLLGPEEQGPEELGGEVVVFTKAPRDAWEVLSGLPLLVLP